MKKTILSSLMAFASIFVIASSANAACPCQMPHWSSTCGSACPIEQKWFTTGSACSACPTCSTSVSSSCCPAKPCCPACPVTSSCCPTRSCGCSPALPVVYGSSCNTCGSCCGSNTGYASNYGYNGYYGY